MSLTCCPSRINSETRLFNKDIQGVFHLQTIFSFAKVEPHEYLLCLVSYVRSSSVVSLVRKNVVEVGYVRKNVVEVVLL